MRNGKWGLVENLFHKLTEVSEVEKQRILFTIKEEDSELHDLLMDLLASDEKSHHIFAESPKNIFDKLDDEESLLGENVGSFQLKKIIGSGAMGTVFLAERNDGQFDQTVAIKLLKPLILNPAMQEVFQRERQILAKLNHPNIARLYDGGYSETNRPFFTMEYVSGDYLSDYIKKKNASLIQKLELFLQVCKAVQYAHQSLIVHLDLKPQNIIVNEEGQVKLLDFGVSKILEDSEEAAGSFTLAYASPEQVQRTNAGTVSDVYSLGIIFYEILFGAHPYQEFFKEPAKLKESILLGDSPSFKIEELPWQAFLTDLEAIYEKATKLKPEDRYQSVELMMRDLQLFLNDYPVSVRPRTLAYSGKKYLKRNRAAVMSISIAILILVGSGIFYTVRLSQERNLAQSEARRANQITDLLSDVFMAADPNVGGADTITAIQLLNQGYENLEKNLGDEPYLYASMISRLAPIFLNLGDYEKGEELTKKAYQINLGLEDVTTETLSDNESQMAAMYYLKGVHDSSKFYSEKAIQRLKEVGDQESVFLSNALVELGNVLYDYGEFDRADSVYQAAFNISNKHVNPPHIELAFELHMIGANARERGDYAKAEKYLLEALEMKKELFEEPHLEIAYTYNHLGSLYQSMKKDSIALGYIEKSLDQRKSILGEFHVETMASMANYARTLVKMGMPKDAFPIYEKTLVITDSLVGKSHYYYWALTGSLGNAQFEAGEYAKAEVNYQISHENFQKILPEGDPRLASPLNGLGKVKMKEKNYALAKEYFLEALKIREAAYPNGHPQIAQSQQALGECMLAIGDYSTAIEFLELALENFQKNSEPSEKEISSIQSSLLAARESI